MKLMFEIPTGPYKASPVVIEALNKLFILHADHEQNCSTSTVRMVGFLMQVYSRQYLQEFQHCGDLYGEEQTRRFLKC
jgi:NADH:ubiquinone oxidoreductase subunit 5 (subunit L)/multisubunit Na+/H+ antiporter MnhA subunit